MTTISVWVIVRVWYFVDTCLTQFATDLYNECNELCWWCWVKSKLSKYNSVKVESDPFSEADSQCPYSGPGRFNFGVRVLEELRVKMATSHDTKPTLHKILIKTKTPERYWRLWQHSWDYCRYSVSIAGVSKKRSEWAAADTHHILAGSQPRRPIITCCPSDIASAKPARFHSQSWLARAVSTTAKYESWN